jgi:hypothetical protein
MKVLVETQILFLQHRQTALMIEDGGKSDILFPLLVIAFRFFEYLSASAIV